MQDGQDSFTKSANNSRNCRQFAYFFEGLDVSLAKKIFGFRFLSGSQSGFRNFLTQFFCHCGIGSVVLYLHPTLIIMTRILGKL